jgi:GNAT superfamily N-acetyltransferase
MGRPLVTSVRTARADEIRDVLGTYQWLFDPPGVWPPRWEPEQAASVLARVLADPRSTVLVVDDGAGRLLGMCTVYLDIESVRFGQRAWVEDLAVHADVRSQGIGKGLLDAAKQWAAQRGATHLELDSGDARAAAHRFYEREQPSWRSRSFGWELRR